MQPAKKLKTSSEGKNGKAEEVVINDDKSNNEGEKFLGFEDFSEFYQVNQILHISRSQNNLITDNILLFRLSQQTSKTQCRHRLKFQLKRAIWTFT